MSRPLMTLVAARGANGVIGIDGALPWRVPCDLKHFKAVTMGRPVLMGRKTWDGLGKPLPGRPNLVVSRDPQFRPEGAFVYAGLEELLAAGAAMARARGVETYCVIGGAQLYAAVLPRADRLVLSEVALSPVGDAFFPPFDEEAFTQTSSAALERTARCEADVTVRVLERRRPVRLGERLDHEEGARGPQASQPAHRLV